MTDKKIEISVIIPVFNAESSIETALVSCQKQTLKHIEILCINDGSTDHSLQVLEKCALNDNRIKIFTHKNQGAAASRNFGLKTAQGEYIAFLDADDEYDDMQALEKMYALAVQKKAEICVGRVNVLSKGNKEPRHKIDDFIMKCQEGTFFDLQFDFYFQTYIYNRSFLATNDINFPLLKWYEDPLFLQQALIRANKIYTCPVNFYFYKWQDQTKKYSKERINDLAKGLCRSLRFAKEYGLTRLLEETLTRVDTIYFADFCDYANEENPQLICYLLEINTYKNQDTIQIKVLQNLFRYGWSKELRYTSLLDNVKNKIPKNSRILLYAAGTVGCKFYKAVKRYPCYEIVAWIDKFKAGQKIDGMSIEEIQKILNYDYDFILIAIIDREATEMAAKELEKNGAETKKIVRWV